MATHNGAAHVGEQLESIIAQLEDRDEIVIVDDGSSDSTLEAVRHVLDQASVKSTVLLNATAEGPKRAFARAIEASEGEYIFLSDQDDVWKPGKVARMASALSEADLIMSDAVVVDAHRRLISPSFYAMRRSGPGLWKNFHKCTYVGCCMAFRRSVADAALPFPQWAYMHDIWLGLVAEARFRTLFLPEALIDYRRHEGNVTSTDSLEKRLSLAIVRRRLALGAALVLRLCALTLRQRKRGRRGF